MIGIFFCKNKYHISVVHVASFHLSPRSSSFFHAVFLHFYGKFLDKENPAKYMTLCPQFIFVQSSLRFNEQQYPLAQLCSQGKFIAFQVLYGESQNRQLKNNEAQKTRATCKSEQMAIRQAQQRTLGRKTMKSTRREQGYSLVRSHIGSLRTTCSACTLRCAHSFGRSLAREWERDVSLETECVCFIQFQPIVQ